MKKFLGFVDKKRTDSRFKKAGEGRSLTDSTPEDKLNSLPPPTSSASKNPSARKPEQTSTAALAAMARLDAKNAQNNKVTPRVFTNNKSSVVDDSEIQSLKMQASMMQKARKEREAKAKAKEEALTTPTSTATALSTVTPPAERKNRGSPFKYICPISGNKFASEVEAKQSLIQCLKQKLSEDPVRFASTMIQCADEDQKNVCIKTITKYIDNAVLHPEEEKFRRIRVGNKAFQDRVVSVPGGLEFITAIHFQETQVDGETYLALNETTLINLIENHEVYKISLIGSPVMKCILDRDIKIINPLKLPSGFDMKALPDSFFVVNKNEVKTMAQQAKETVNDGLSLRTSAMRNEKKNNAIKTYRFALVRVRVSNEQIWQATFKAGETMGDVLQTFSDSIHPNVFTLVHPDGTVLDDVQTTLRDCGVAPSAMLTLKTDVPNSIVLLSSLSYL